MYTYTASVCSEFKNRPCSRLSLNTSELEKRTKIKNEFTYSDHDDPSIYHILTLSPQNTDHKRGSDMKSPFQTLEFVSYSSVPAGSGTQCSGHSAKTPTAQPRCSRGGVFMNISQ